LQKRSNLDELLYRVRLKKAREGDAKQLFKGIMDEFTTLLDIHLGAAGK